MKRETIKTIALIALAVFGYTWFAIRAPGIIYNFRIWIDTGLLLTIAILGVLWLIDRAEKKP